MFNIIYLSPLVIEALAALMAFDIGIVKFKSTWSIIISAIVFVALGVAEVLMAMYFGIDFMGSEGALILLAVLFLLAACLRNCKRGQFIFGASYILLVCLITSFVSMVLKIYLGFDDIARFAGFVAWSILAYLVSEHSGVERLRRAFSIIDEGWYLFSLLPSLGCVLTMLITFMSTDTMSHVEMAVIVVTLISTILALIVFFYLFDRLDAAYSMKHDLESTQFQLDNYRFFYNQQVEREEENRRIRHDRHHALQLLIDLLQEGKIDEALERLYQLRGADNVPMERFCYNDAVNGILRLWSMRAMDEGIDMEIRTSVPEETGIDDMELSLLFANLLENAFESCQRLETNEHDRFIKVNCEDKDGKLVCTIKDSCRHDVLFQDGMPKTQKPKGGIGTVSAKTTVEKYNGIIRYSAEDGVFTTRFILPISV